MKFYIITEEPYHENSTTVGVFLDLVDARRFTESRPDHPFVSDYDKPECWMLQEWDSKSQSALRCWYFSREVKVWEVQNSHTQRFVPLTPEQLKVFGVKEGVR